MHAAQASTRALTLDPKRIAATSAAIAVHIGVLMMLMMPAQLAPPKVVKDLRMEFVPIEKKIELILAPKPPEAKPKPRDAVQQPLPLQTPVHVEVENTEPRPNDTFVDSTTTEEVIDSTFTVAPQPAFAQIRADLFPAPPYPQQALARRLTGQVMLRVLVDETGKPLDVVVETSSGVAMLDEAAVKFVRKRWHFVPATQDGRAIQAYALVPINFVLDR